MNKSATNSPRTRTKKAEIGAKKRDVRRKSNPYASSRSSPSCTNFANIQRKMRRVCGFQSKLRCSFATSSLPVRYKRATYSLQSCYIAERTESEEIPLDAKFMSSVLVADDRTVEKSFEELLSKNLLKRERKEKKRKDRQTDREKSVCLWILKIFSKQRKTKKKSL